MGTEVLTYAPFWAGTLVRRSKMAGRAVKPEIQNTVAPKSCDRQARKPISLKKCDVSSCQVGNQIQVRDTGF